MFRPFKFSTKIFICLALLELFPYFVIYSYDKPRDKSLKTVNESILEGYNRIKSDNQSLDNSYGANYLDSLNDVEENQVRNQSNGLVKQKCQSGDLLKTRQKLTIESDSLCQLWETNYKSGQAPSDDLPKRMAFDNKGNIYFNGNNFFVFIQQVQLPV